MSHAVISAAERREEGLIAANPASRSQHVLAELIEASCTVLMLSCSLHVF